MTTTVIVGAQWGDEGKGKNVDQYAADAKMIVRYAGGPNAGHTLVIDGQKRVVRQLSVGIVRRGMRCVNGPYVATNPQVVQDEMVHANASGAVVLLDGRSPLILPIHQLLDGLRETASGPDAIGTTKNGIGPCYADFTDRRAPVLGDLVSEDHFAKALRRGGFYAEREAVIRHYGGQAQSFDEVVAWGAPFAAMIRELLADTAQEVQMAVRERMNVVFEGAQGVMLELIHGQMGSCTSSFCGIGAISASLGVHAFDQVIGIIKAYVTRVGGGSLPTEMEPTIGRIIRERGGEFGAVTGRERRPGWLDLRALDYAIRVGGITKLIMNKLDVLSEQDVIQVCTEYEVEGKAVGPRATLTADILAKAKPLYQDLPGWKENIRQARKFKDLPITAQHYVTEMERCMKVPIIGVGVGPGREDFIRRGKAA